MLLASSRLSESPIWDLQKLAYSQLGVESWTKERVPLQITNNARIAAQYADIACAAFPKGDFTILELGGGCGKFAFLLISELIRRNIPKIRYFLTDAALKNVAYWKQHPRLLTWIEQGILEPFPFDPLFDDPPSADLIIANYFFDSIPQDLFRVEKGMLFEGIASLHAEIESADWSDPNLLSKLRVEYAYRKLENHPYPECPEAVAVLEEYARNFDELSFLFPIGAIRTVQRMQSRAKDDFFFLATDRGPCFAEDLSYMPLLPSLHGSAFSYPVNFHAMGRYMEKIGGKAHFSQEADFSAALFYGFSISANHMACRGSQESMAKKCFEAQKFGPLNADAADFSEIIIRLKEAHWDPTLFFYFFDRIQVLFDQANNVERRVMIEGMTRVRNLFYPLFRDESILLERLGLFLQSLGEEALSCFEWAASLEKLPRQSSIVAAFIKAHLPSGDVLVIGGKEEDLDSIRSAKLSSLVAVEWKALGDELGTFDAIFLFPPRLALESQKPAFIRDIEKQFSLDTIRYSDRDIEAFFSASSNEDPVRVFHFFLGLEKKKNITREQLEWVSRRLSMEVPALEENDLFFDILMTCLKKHTKPQSVLRAFIPGIVTYDDSRFFEEVVVDPYLEVEEIAETEGIWLTIRKGSLP